jgi:hypothetical protein
MPYVSSWKSSLWETDPKAGLHSFVKTGWMASPFSSYYGLTVWECSKCGAQLKTGDRKGMKPPSPKWGPHCAEFQIKRVIDG